MVTNIEHAAEALKALDLADGSGGMYQTAYLTKARVHAELAHVEVLHEIAHQLRPPTCEEVDSSGRRCILRPGHEGAHRIGLGG